MTAIEEAKDALVELELDPTRKLLEAATLTGTTAERWRIASAALEDAWAASEEGALARMRDGAAQARACLDAVSAAWDALVPRLQAINDTLRAATQLGATPAAEQRELQRLTALVAADPLGAHEAAIAALEGSVAGLRDFQARPREQLAAAQAALAELRRLEADARAAHATAAEKIAGERPEPPALPSDLESGLEAIAGLVAREEWLGAHAALSEWSRRTDELTAAQRRVLDANREPLEARRALRGLLDAYQAKAAALRMLEDPELGERLARAQRALYTAPTDLDEAARLVHEYRDGLSAEVRP
jgi:hypothetical protein